MFYLTAKEELVITRRRQKKTLQEIGDELGVTRERIRQIESKASEKIRQNEKEEAEVIASACNELLKVHVSIKQDTEGDDGFARILTTALTELYQFGFTRGYLSGRNTK